MPNLSQSSGIATLALLSFLGCSRSAPDKEVDARSASQNSVQTANIEPPQKIIPSEFKNNNGILVVEPSSHAVVSNHNSKLVHFFMNGMFNSPERILYDAQCLADACGSPVKVIVNPSEPSKEVEICGAILGMIDTKLGALVEPQPLHNLISQLNEELKAGHTVIIHAHSKAGIIVADALSLLKQQVGEKKWKELYVPNLKIRSYASATLEWPEELDVKAYAHKDDWVLKVSELAQSLREKLGLHLGKVVKVNTIPGASHMMDDYVKNLSEFFINEYTAASGELDGEKLASALVIAIREGIFNDDIAIGIIKRMADMHDKPFAREFLKHVENSKIGNLNLDVPALHSSHEFIR